MNAELVSQINSMGFPQDRATMIHAFVGGSKLHGVKLEDKDDHDLYGIFIEHPYYVCGLEKFEHFVTSTAAQADRNTASDVDIVCYSLRKWVTLALKGNPTILQFLFTPALKDDYFWSKVLGYRDNFLAKKNAHQYMAYADAQLHRMAGERGTGKHGQRDELVIKFGFDTKAAMHTCRVLLEGIELMRTGWITLPRPAHEKEWLLAIRRGEWSMERVLQESKRLFEEIKTAMTNSKLPDEVTRPNLGKFVAETYLECWGLTPDCSASCSYC